MVSWWYNGHSELMWWCMKRQGLLLNARRHVSLIAASWFWLGALAFAEPRAPHVAGQFYPADRTELRTVVQGLLEAKVQSQPAECPRILIAPHAGYEYSGPVAGSAFRLVRGCHYDAVVVVGFTHQFAFNGISVDTRESYETPLGLIPVDLEAVKFLQTDIPAADTRSAHGPAVSYLEEAHAAPEHSLEVELPYLQVALGDFKLVPILMGRPTREDAARLADALAALAHRGNYLFVFSTDLSHYHPDEIARQLDQGTIDAMLFETPQAVDRLFNSQLVEACGRGPIMTSLFLAAKLGYLKRMLVRYGNSGDATGDRQRVVGYGAIAMYDVPPPTTGRLSQEAGMALVQAARNTLEGTLLRGQGPKPIPVDRYPELAQADGIFVTLRRNGQLRGCIGRIETDEPLAQSVPRVALDAALRDTRFPPVTGEDLGEISLEVSVLTPPVRLADLKDLVPGRDGVVLEAQGHRGVFLPTVWDESGWTRREFLEELASQKAGLPREAWQGATLFVFQDQVFEEAPVPVAAH